MFHLGIYSYLNVSSVPSCVLVLDSSNPYPLRVRVVPTIAGGGGRVGVLYRFFLLSFPLFVVCVRERVCGGGGVGWGGWRGVHV